MATTSTDGSHQHCVNGLQGISLPARTNAVGDILNDMIAFLGAILSPMPGQRAFL
jgi:hypothetical protein